MEIIDPDALARALKSRACESSKLDYENASWGPIQYRSRDEIPGTDWAFPDRVVLIKPPEYAGQNESRIVLPLKPGVPSKEAYITIKLGNLEEITRFHHFE